MNQLSKCLFLLFALSLLAVGQQARAAAKSPAGVQAGPEPREVPLSGKVLETMDGGGYTYLLLKTGAEKVWVAIPLMKVSLGQELTLIPGFEMKNFTSKGLHRKFERVVFSAGPAATREVKLSQSAIEMAHKGVPMNAPMAAAPDRANSAAAKSGAARPVPVSMQRVARAKGPNAYTVAQLYAKKAKLEKKPVVVRGRVVKVSPGILKRNWVHIQDGSGSEARKNNNLVVTSKQLPKEGDLVTVSGTLFNNLDFGSGYRYSVLVEGARFR